MRPATLAKLLCAEAEAARANTITIVKKEQTTKYRLLISLPISPRFSRRREGDRFKHLSLYSRGRWNLYQGLYSSLWRHSLDGTEAIVSWIRPSRVCGWAKICSLWKTPKMVTSLAGS